MTRACRVCSCTQDRACLTAAGPCWWVEWDLCSACVGSAFDDLGVDRQGRGPAPAARGVLIGLLLTALVLVLAAIAFAAAAPGFHAT